MTTADYLNQLEQDREDLVDNLETQGITGLTGDETFTELVPEVLNISGGADLTNYFDNSVNLDSNNNIRNLVKKLISPITLNGNYPPSFGTLPKLIEIPDIILNNVNNLNGCFSGCKLITTIPLFDTTGVTSMRQMFNNCSALTSVPLLNTSSVTDMYQMFNSCTNLESVPLFITTNVTNMNSFISWCTHITAIPQFDTSSVTDMRNMFNGCSALTTIPLLNTSSVTNMQNMFSSCNALNTTSLDNMLQMCINATNYTETKTLYWLGVQTGAFGYPTATIQALPHYNDFISAGWTIS